MNKCSLTKIKVRVRSLFLELEGSFFKLIRIKTLQVNQSIYQNKDTSVINFIELNTGALAQWTLTLELE